MNVSLQRHGVFLIYNRLAVLYIHALSDQLQCRLDVGFKITFLDPGNSGRVRAHSTFRLQPIIVYITPQDAQNYFREVKKVAVSYFCYDYRNSLKLFE